MALRDTSNNPVFAEVDLFKNQTATPTSVSGYPAAYIDFPYSCYKDSSAKIQLGNIMIKIMLCFDSALSNSVSILELKNAVYTVLQGEYLEAVQPSAGPAKFYAILSRSMEHTNLKFQGIYIYEIDFYTSIKDMATYRLKDFTPYVLGYELTTDVEKMDQIKNPENNINTTQQILKEEE